MAAYTENYNLILPEEDDYYNVEDFNENFRSVDTALSSVEDSLDNIDAMLNSINQKLDQLASKSSGAVRSVQTVNVSLTTNEPHTTTHAINAVNPAKCMVLMNEMKNPYANQPFVSYALYETSFVVNTTASSHTDYHLKFQIVEFY